MELADLIVEVRDVNLVRIGQVPHEYLTDSVFAPRVNGVGTWSMRLPDQIDGKPFHLAQALQTEGAGIIVTTGDDVFMSGLVEEAANEADADDPAGIWTFSGPTDTVHIEDAVALPDPTQPDPTLQTRDKDARAGKVETLLHAFVRANVSAAPAVRRSGHFWAKITNGADGGRGPTASAEARFTNLLALCQQLAAGTSVLFQVIQRGSGLVFETSVSPQLTEVRLDVENDQVRTSRSRRTAPRVTHAILGGDGKGTARTIVSVSGPTAPWGRRREAFYNAQGTTDVTELQRQGLVEIEAPVDGFQVIPTEHALASYSPARLLGATIRVAVGDKETPTRVTQVALSVSEEGVGLAVTLGDDHGDWEEGVDRALSDLESRVAVVERNVELPSSFAVVSRPISDWNMALDPGTYWSYAGGTVNGPLATWLVGEVHQFGTGNNLRIVQTVQDPNSVPVPRVWRRVFYGDGTGWREWFALDGWNGMPLDSPTAPGDDLNNALATGFYRASGSTLNSPSSSTWWNVIVENSGSRSTQTASQLDRRGDVWKRWREPLGSGGAWTPWILLSRQTTSIAPSFRGGVSLGNGTAELSYSVSDGVCMAVLRMTLGSTTSISGDFQLSQPVPLAAGHPTIHGANARITVGAAQRLAHTIVASGILYVRTLTPSLGAGGVPGSVLMGSLGDQTFGSGNTIEATWLYPIG
ncbi:hypothetical protein G3H63_15560 [Microbacterium resistens]|uniref:Gp37-like protein n=1 Tax=Microbacterium resistens TaxID=156977 RepID=UPI001C568AB4|nr:hypothetical protein [Microbacterium resistens]MBW1640481.1 hypothetical protein [Microbacterium resistens]